MFCYSLVERKHQSRAFNPLSLDITEGYTCVSLVGKGVGHSHNVRGPEWDRYEWTQDPDIVRMDNN